MVSWSPSQIELMKRFRTKDDIPLSDRKYKCHTCKLILTHQDTHEKSIVTRKSELPQKNFFEKKIVVCNLCENEVETMCPLDHCNCSEDVIGTIEYCPICNHQICPECGCHDVVQISRVTGYLQEVGGWNAAKQQELKDRTRYDIAVSPEQPATSTIQDVSPAIQVTLSADPPKQHAEANV